MNAQVQTEARRELKDRYCLRTCPCCGAENHVLVTYDQPRTHSLETGTCWRCGADVYSERCFMIWTADSLAAVERRAGHAARLRRAL